RPVCRRHPYVSAQYVESVAVLGPRQRLFGAAGTRDGVAPAFEHLRDDLTHDVFVLDEQEALAPTARLRRRLRRLLRADIRPRQVDVEDRACARFAVDGDVTAGLLDDPEDHRQAETGAVADVLRGEGRLEEAPH